MSQYIRRTDKFFVGASGSISIHDTLPVGTYDIQHDIDHGFFLQRVDDAGPPAKLYGDISRNANRILDTYHDRTNSTGVLLSGEKGSGKTLLAKLLSWIGREKYGMSTITVSQSFKNHTAFKSVIQQITDPVIIVFDEFEKTYSKEEQEQILTLLDGMFSSKKLFVMTCNDMYKVDEHILNRPGRLFYHIEHDGLAENFITDYCNDNLKDASHLPELLALTNLYYKFNFDMLQAVVQEVNRYGESPAEVVKLLNVKPTAHKSDKYTIHVEDKRGKVKRVYSQHHQGNPMLCPDIDVRYELTPSADYIDEFKDEDGETDGYIAINLRQSMMTKFDSDKSVWEYIEPDSGAVVTIKSANIGRFDVVKSMLA